MLHRFEGLREIFSIIWMVGCKYFHYIRNEITLSTRSVISETYHVTVGIHVSPQYNVDYRSLFWTFLSLTILVSKPHSWCEKTNFSEISYTSTEIFVKLIFSMSVEDAFRLNMGRYLSILTVRIILVLIWFIWVSYFKPDYLAYIYEEMKRWIKICIKHQIQQLI